MGDFFRDFLIGGISAAVLKTVFAPFHIIKLHTSHDYNKVGKRYKGIIDCFISFLREEGFAMWRGNLANVIRIFPVQALNFAFKDAYRKFFSPFGKLRVYNFCTQLLKINFDYFYQKQLDLQIINQLFIFYQKCVYIINLILIYIQSDLQIQYIIIIYIQLVDAFNKFRFILINLQFFDKFNKDKNYVKINYNILFKELQLCSFLSVYNVYQPDSKNEKLLFFLGNMASGSAAGAASLITFHPLDFGRTRLDADFGMKHKKKFTDLTNCLSKVYKSDGFIGLYRYFGVSVLQVSLFRGLKFGTYDTAKETIFQKKLMSNIFAKCIAYFITHIVDFISRPLDTIRRMMMQLKRADILYKNTLDCAVNIARKEGTQAFFKGPIYYKEYYSFVLVLYDESNQLIAQRSKSA